MENNVNVNRPASVPQQHQAPQMNMGQGYSRPSRAPWIILAVVVIVVLAVLGFLFRDKLSLGSKKDSNVSQYDAVFLTNGQVYFGKLSDKGDKYITLKDIYYLQVNQALQSGTQTQSNQQPELSLVKLGNELHGPVDEMQINRDQVLFFEMLKNDGKVAQAIAEYQKNPQGTTTTPSNGTSTNNGTGTSTGTGTTPDTKK